jgi:hypothetical protein
LLLGHSKFYYGIGIWPANNTSFGLRPQGRRASQSIVFGSNPGASSTNLRMAKQQELKSRKDKRLFQFFKDSLPNTL